MSPQSRSILPSSPDLSRYHVVILRFGRRIAPSDVRVPRSNRGRARFSLEASANLDLYLLGFGSLALRHVNREHAVLELSLYFVGVGQVGKSETSDETAVGPFDSMDFLLLLFLLELAFAVDRQDSVLDCHF